MPLGIGLLTHLRTLSKFIVDKGKGRKIFELKSLNHLQGTISIVGMENVMNVKDAMEANLLGKEGLDGLEMKWSSDFITGTREGGLEFDVLDALKPRIGLANLEIEFYGGQKFPSWVGDHSFCDMVKVRLTGCENCRYLPPLGQLTSLKELFIEGMGGVKLVGQEFLVTKFAPHIVAFRSLINLSFTDMDDWEEWSTDSTSGAFPCLQELKMCRCMKLNKVSLAKIPTLESLEIYGCSETVLKSVVGVGSVKKLEVGDVSGLSKLDVEIIGCLREIEDLSVSDCEQLRYLWEEEVACQVLEKLKSLSVKQCQQLESLGDKEQLLPRSLESLELEYCDKLEKMPNWQNSLTSLRRLRIIYCEKLQHNLASRQQGEDEFSNLDKVSIIKCPCLKWFPTGKKLPPTLRDLFVSDCVNMAEAEKSMPLPLSLLESVYIFDWSNLKSLPQGLAYLTRLCIGGCSSRESIPERSLPPTLLILIITECKNLKSMCPNEMQSLTSLRYLTITWCSNLEGYPSGGHWPPNLEYLTMGDVKQPITEWGLATLPTSLCTFRFYGEFLQLVSFSEVGTQLPTSLTRLQIMLLKNLESLGQGLENLSSLQHLYLYQCPKVRELPEKLLPMLSSLVTLECPVVSEGCKKEKRDYWPKISHIPCLIIEEICNPQSIQPLGWSISSSQGKWP